MKKTFMYALLLCLSFLTGCATNTMTGRSQLSLVSDEAAAKQSMGLYSGMVSDLSKKNKLITGTPLNARVDAITNKLISQAVLYHPKSQTWDWKLSVIDDPNTVNAFCMPGGLMAIYTGLIQKLNATDDEIAQVMGHEIGHALAGHGAEKMSMQQVTSVTALVVSAAVSKDNREFRNNADAANLAALAFINLPNSRLTETEADAIGIELAARAGYAPGAAVTLWKKMAANSGAKGKGDFFSTHPAPERRIENLTKLGGPMAPLFAAAKADTTAQYDWLNGPKTSRPKVSENARVAFYSEAWDAFKDGRLILTGSNLPGFVVKQTDFANLEKAQNWRDLAALVMKTDYDIDLSYYYLGKAAIGLGFADAGKAYLRRAKEMNDEGTQSCRTKTLMTCKGVEFASIAE